ncbi:rhomboid family intramembrane serine protease [Leptospira montravelensis]|uniref:Rhomboid family intramembrane serine protease n=1 Tax=Leptospira montravelensis TaxID=2484961 RepID=A0ABY2LWE2_9LEPT|nr:rhomboid family intramembrane serine protease [Leptospira montravelensis]TGK84540.1 rhomboid family intramembrane serine protease [Leptospira montravelensis]TGL06842.1 rhomboid family intramembrane serine protease [Leptospira montravelensis]
MASRYPGYELRFGPPMVPVVRTLMIINGILFLLQMATKLAFHSPLVELYFGLNPDLVFSGWVWQLLSYAFLHGSFLHILFNMLSLWMFGSELAEIWGERAFLKFYLFTAFLGGVFTVVAHFSGFSQGLVVGASASIYGLLVAYAMTWPNRELLVFLIFPMRAKYFVMIVMLMVLFAQGERVAHFAHLGGAIGGFFLMKVYTGWRKKTNSLPTWSLARYLQKRRFMRYQEEMAKRENAKTKVDELLEKISKNGMESLSRSERKFLNEASQKYFNE